jgi:hypothetical protein
MKSQTQNDKKDSAKNIRIHHHRLDKEYTVVPNHGVENETLSWGAKGLLWYMISRESTFEIHSWHLASIHKGTKRGNGIDAVRVMLDELKKHGYLVHHKYQNAEGQWEHRYDIYPIPIHDFQKMFPDRVKPDVAEPGVVKPDVLPITDRPITDLPIKESIKEADPLQEKKPAATSMVSSSPIPAESSIPIDKGKVAIDLNCPDLCAILDMEPVYMPFFRPRIVSVWIEKFGSVMVLDTIKFFFKVKQTQSKAISSPEAWMEIALKKKFTAVAKTVEVNKLFAQNLKKKYNFRDLKINKRYCECTRTGKDLYYSLPEQVFKESLLNLCQNI